MTPPMPPQALVQQPGQHGAGVGLAPARAARTGPSRRGGKSGGCGSAAGPPGPPPGWPGVRPRRASGWPGPGIGTAAVASHFRPATGIWLGPNCITRRVRWTCATSGLRVQQQAVAGFIERIGQGSLEFGQHWPWEERRQEAVDRLVIARPGRHNGERTRRWPPLRSASDELDDVTAALIRANPFFPSATDPSPARNKRIR